MILFCFFASTKMSSTAFIIFSWSLSCLQLDYFDMNYPHISHNEVFLVFVLLLRILAFLNYQIIFFLANLFIDFKNRSKFKNQWWFWPLYAVFYNFMKKLIWTILMLMFLILNLNRTWQHIRKNHQIYLWY